MPKLAVLADIHANYAAFEAVLSAVRKESVDGVILLGDYLTDCPYPERTLSLIRTVMAEWPTWIVRGNREDYLLEHRRRGCPDEWHKGSSTGSLLYTYERLTDADLDFLAALPTTVDVRLPDCPPITACHASPFVTKEWIVDDPERMRAALRAVDSSLILCGHTHIPGSFSFPEGRLIVCPSCGLPQDLAFNYMILTLKNDRWVERMCRADYDIEAFIRAYEESPMPEYAPIWTISVIRMLRDRTPWAVRCVNLAYRLARRDQYEKPLESYWTEAACRLQLTP